MKTRAQIAAETIGKPKNERQFAPPPGYVPHAKLEEWDSSLTLGAEEILKRCEPRNDRMIVQLIEEPQTSAILLTDAKPLIGGDCRKARVLKVGPGKWIEGEWWKVRKRDGGLLYEAWEWFEGCRRPIAVSPGQIVLIGNWVDLEAKGLVLCQESDVRSVWGN
jgi:hypothetical protein